PGSRLWRGRFRTYCAVPGSATTSWTRPIFPHHLVPPDRSAVGQHVRVALIVIIVNGAVTDDSAVPLPIFLPAMTIRDSFNGGGVSGHRAHSDCSAAHGRRFGRASDSADCEGNSRAHIPMIALHGLFFPTVGGDAMARCLVLSPIKMLGF